MHGRKWVALVMVLALTGSALALQQQKVYHRQGGDPAANDVPVIQQHAVFTELIVEENDTASSVTEFAAVVGLVKKCQQVDNVFDNAVLWFNDQFLFGQKHSIRKNVTKNESMGFNPNRTHDNSTLLNENRRNGTGQYDPTTGEIAGAQNGTGPDEGGNPIRDGFIRANGDSPLAERWGGCFIPNGFVHAIGGGTSSLVPGIEDAQAALESSNNDCDGDGCMFEYEGTHYVTDPNNHRWMIDRYTWNSAAGPHPWYTLHLQVDPWSPDRQGFPDEAIWTYDETGRIRLGLPYNEDPDGNPCHDEARVDGEKRFADSVFDHKADAGEYDEMPREGGTSQWAEWRRGPIGNTVECSIEYSFLFAVDFASFEGTAIDRGNIEDGDGENHVVASDSSEGNSHPHNPLECYRNGGSPGDECDPGPAHEHNEIALDIFFNTRAPWFTEQHPYWDQPTERTTVGEPPIVMPGCQDTINPNDPRRPAIQVRDPLVCDVLAFTGFHLHDGSQTPNPTN